MADISVSLTLDDSGFNRGLNNADKKVKQFGDSASKKLKDIGSTGEKAGNSISDAFGKLQGVLAGIGITAFVADLAKTNAEIVNTAKSLGISTAAALTFQKSMAAAGGDADNARDAMISLAQAVDEAMQSGGDSLDTFNKLGMSLTDLQKLSQEDIMKQTVIGLGKLKDGSDAAGKSVKLFGEDAKNTDWGQMAANYESTGVQVAKLAPAFEAAQKAQKEYNKQYENFKDQVTVAIPWEDLTSGLKLIGENLGRIGDFAAGILAIGTAFLFVSKVMVPLREVSAGLTTALGGLTIADHIGATFMHMADTAKSVFTVFTAGGLTVAGFRASLGALFALMGQVGVIYALVTGINALVKAFTGFDIIDSVGLSFKSLQRDFAEMAATVEYFGITWGLMTGDIENATKRYDMAMDHYKNGLNENNDLLNENKKTINDNKEALDKNNDAKTKAAELIGKHAKAANDLTSAYQKQSDQQLKSIEDQTKLIGIGDDYKAMKQELINLENAHAAKLEEVNAKLKESEIANNPELAAQYKKSIDDINAAYDKQKSQVEDLTNAQSARVQVERMQQFATEQRIAGTQRIRDLENEQAKVFLPLIEQKYKDIEKAATDAITAQVEAEAKSRGVTPSDVPLSVVESITAEVRKQIEIEKEKAKAVEDTNNAYNLQKFALESITDTNSQVQKVYDDLAKLTLPELAQQEYDVAAAAKEHAEQAIRAEEARRNAALSPEEAKAYYEAASRGSDKLIKAQKELYKQSRTFATGWKQAMNDYVSQAGNAANHAKNIFNTMFSGLEDLLVNFVKTGKFEWKNFLATMLEELLRAQIQAVFAGMLGDMSGSMKGSSGGGILDSIMGLFGGGSTKDKGSSGGILGSLWSGIKGLFGGGDSATGAATTGTDSATGGAAASTGLLSDLWGGIKDIGGGVVDGISSIGSGISDVFSGIGGGLTDALSGIGGGIVDTISSIGSTIGSSISGLLSGAAGAGSSLLGSLGGGLSAIMGAAGTSVTAANDLFSSMWSGVGSALGGLGSAFSGFFANGGTIPSGSWGIVGEAGPEIVNGPANITPMSQVGGSTNITYNINAIDSMSFKQMIAKDPSFIYGVTMQGAKGTAIRR